MKLGWIPAAYTRTSTISRIVDKKFDVANAQSVGRASWPSERAASRSPRAQNSAWSLTRSLPVGACGYAGAAGSAGARGPPVLSVGMRSWPHWPSV